MAIEVMSETRRGLRYADMVVDTPGDFRVQSAVYTDPAIFEDELVRIFESTWVYLAHESEVQQPGDYRTGYVGRQPVIVSRDENGQIHVLLNMCRHRGNVVCREERGNSSFFRCSYHGWVYANDGTLTGIAERHGYAENFGEKIDGLGKVPAVAVYRGLIFASLNPHVPDFEDYLGEVKPYVDMWVERSPTGTVRVLRPHKYRYPASWKFQSEQDTDGYHGRYVHESAFKTLEHFHGSDVRKDRNMSVHGVGCTRGFPNGHAVLERPGTRGELPAPLLAEYLGQLERSYGADRAEKIAMVRHVLVFPNLYLMDDHLRAHYPLGVNSTEVRSFFTVLEDAPDEVNRLRLKNLQWRHSQAGMIGTDDVEMFVGCQSGMHASSVGWIVLERGLDREELLATGERIGESADETPQRAIYREWARLMNAGTEAGDRPW